MTIGAGGVRSLDELLDVSWGGAFASGTNKPLFGNLISIWDVVDGMGVDDVIDRFDRGAESTESRLGVLERILSRLGATASFIQTSSVSICEERVLFQGNSAESDPSRFYFAVQEPEWIG